ncbi:urea transporter [Sinimarinibacterium sp. NLF-5-8]|uniref:urea transporter n=1 Tax=Sinimarinibacterium sp. NLF-5-8 TaxID=2698684 RepID=UPI00137BCBE8|nr:urea transporter [Sinimarinibacterium sp. NLF-5-8]QHS10441.1 urea transporter [Sinimarinibacterium sp. NLF-5-8]
MLDRTGLIVTANTPAPLTFLDSVLRGIGQVMLQNNAYAGVLFLIGIFLNSALFGGGVIVGTVVSTLTAQALGAKTSDVRAGLFGFNGALVAIALLYFLEPNALTWGCVVLASACSTVLMAALMQLFKVFNLPVLTAPFVFTSLGFFLAIARFGRLQSTQQLPTAGLPQSTAVEGIVTHTTVIEGLLGGVAQVFFQASVLTGVIFVAALLISSWRACVMALLGSLLGVLIAWGMGAAEPAIRAGAFGFNSVLTAIALGSVFLRPGLGALVYTALGCAATTVVYAGLSAALEPIGMPAMTLPFVLVTWVFVAATPLFARLRAA